MWRKTDLKANFGKIFEGNIAIEIQLITLIQMFCETILSSQVIAKSIIGPDDNF